MNTGREASVANTAAQREESEHSDLEIRVVSIRQSATFLAFVPSGRNTPCRIAVRPSPDSQEDVCAARSRLCQTSVSGRCASLCKEA
jgi:hypothetical protein